MTYQFFDTLVLSLQTVRRVAETKANAFESRPMVLRCSVSQIELKIQRSTNRCIMFARTAFSSDKNCTNINISHVYIRE